MALTDWLVEALDRVWDFWAEEGPIFWKEIVRWSFLEHLYWVLVGLLFITICCYISDQLFQEAKKDDCPCDDVVTWAVVIRITGLLLGGGFVVYNFLGLLQTGIAPDVTVLEKVSSLIK